MQWVRIYLPVHGTQVGSLIQKIPHAVEQLSPCARTAEPTCLEPVLHNKRSHHNEKSVHHEEV